MFLLSDETLRCVVTNVKSDIIKNVAIFLPHSRPFKMYETKYCMVKVNILF